MTKARYIFWDSDNTLAENGELHWQKHLETAKKYGVTLNDSHRSQIYHNNGHQNWTWLKKELGLKADQNTYLEEIDIWYAAHVGDIPLRPGIAEALEMFRAAGCRQCVVSNGRRNSVLLALNARDIVSKFDFILCKEDYEGRKPNPSPYLTAIRKMEDTANETVQPYECLAIEDDPLGVTSAFGAQIPVIHRRLHKKDPVAPEAIVSVYDEGEFLAACRNFI